MTDQVDTTTAATTAETPTDAAVTEDGDTTLQSIRDLTTQIQKLQEDSQKYSGLVKGVVAGIVGATLSVTISGDSTIVAGLGYLSSYGPKVGDVVLMEKQGPDFVILGTIATGSTWTTLSLASGFTGSPEYRVVNDFGSLKVQLRGRVDRTSGTTIVSSLPTEARPLTTRYLGATRGWGGGSTAIQVIVNTGGSLVIDGATAAPTASTNSVDPNDTTTNSSSSDTGGANGDTSGYALSGYLSQAGSDLGHNHTIGHGHGMNHTHGVTGAHSHTVTVSVTAPDWVSLDGLEYWI